MLSQLWEQIEPKVKQWIREYAPWVTLGNVTSLSPLTVQPDGPGSPMYPSTNLVTGLTDGSRVYMITFAGRTAIVGATNNDTGWVPLVVSGAGFSGVDVAVCRVGGVVMYRGEVSGSFSAGANYNVLTAPVGFRPVGRAERAATVSTVRDQWAALQVNTSGAFLVQSPVSGTFTFDLGSMFYRV